MQFFSEKLMVLVKFYDFNYLESEPAQQFRLRQNVVSTPAPAPAPQHWLRQTDIFQYRFWASERTRDKFLSILWELGKYRHLKLESIKGATELAIISDKIKAF
jgi:hypothetical protein